MKNNEYNKIQELRCKKLLATIALNFPEITEETKKLLIEKYKLDCIYV